MTTTTKEQRACEWDAVMFTPERSTARFCSIKCRVAAHRAATKGESSVTPDGNATSPSDGPTAAGGVDRDGGATLHLDVAELQAQVAVLTAQLTRDGKRPTRSEMVKALLDDLSQAFRERRDIERKAEAEIRDLKRQLHTAEMEAKAARNDAAELAAGSTGGLPRRLGGLSVEDIDTLGSLDTTQLGQFAQLAKRMAQRGDTRALHDALQHVTSNSKTWAQSVS